MGLEQPMTFQEGERVWEDREDPKPHSSRWTAQPFAMTCLLPLTSFPSLPFPSPPLPFPFLRR